MSWIYPRTISISRVAVPTEFGAPVTADSYSGESPQFETPVASGIPASIQQKSTSAKPGDGLPGDAINVTQWRVMIPLGACALGTIQTRDVITDDIGGRYQVTAPYWNSCGHNLLCERLEL